ncbi:hypothetical protein T08_9603, partial [Trichinella sp. T8]
LVIHICADSNCTEEKTTASVVGQPPKLIKEVLVLDISMSTHCGIIAVPFSEHSAVLKKISGT